MRSGTVAPRNRSADHWGRGTTIEMMLAIPTTLTQRIRTFIAVMITSARKEDRTDDSGDDNETDYVNDGSDTDNRTARCDDVDNDLRMTLVVVSISSEQTAKVGPTRRINTLLSAHSTCV